MASKNFEDLLHESQGSSDSSSDDDGEQSDNVADMIEVTCGLKSFILLF